MKGTPTTRFVQQDLTKEFQDAVIDLPIDSGRCKVTIDMLMVFFESNPEARVLVVSEASHTLRHLEFEADKTHLKLKLAKGPKDISKRDPITLLSADKIKNMRKCQTNSFDLLIAIDVISPQSTSLLSTFLSKCPAKQTMWIIEPYKKKRLLLNSVYLSEQMEKQLVSFIDYDLAEGLVHSSIPTPLKGRHPLATVDVSSKFTDFLWEH